MGSSCSMHRQGDGPLGRGGRHRDSNQRNRSGSGGSASSSSEGGSASHRSLRHSVVSAIPDGSIETLYPVDDNYVNVGKGLRSPKSLSELATEALCRSLPYLDGALPPGLPQDVVDDVVHSLHKHSALNATTLRVLRNCELGSLNLAGCRGVTDEWLEPLSKADHHFHQDAALVVRHMFDASSSCSSPRSSVNSSSPGLGAAQDVGSSVENMDLDHSPSTHPPLLQNQPHQAGSSMEADAESSCSASSFVSATSNPYSVSASSTSDTHPTVEKVVDSSTSATELEDLPMMDTKQAHELQPPPLLSTATLMMPSATANMKLLDLRGSQRLTDRGLMQLCDLTNLEIAKLDHCHSIVGRGLLAFSSSHRLHTLSLANCRRLTDEAIINISHLDSLEALSLDGCRCLTDRSLVAIADLYQLRRLDLSQCDLVTDKGLQHLGTLTMLEECSLGWCRQVTDVGVHLLTQQEGRDTCLRVLRLARCAITDTGISYLARLLSLVELDLNGCSNVSSAALGDTLQRIPQLEILDVSYCPGILRSGWQGKINSLKVLELCYSGVRDSHLGKLHSCPQLVELNLDSCPMGDWAISHLAEHNVVPNLRSLDLADSNLTDQGMIHIPKFVNLTRLSLFYCNISNHGLRHVAKLAHLETLNLDSRDISDDGLRYLSKLKKLKSLDIFSGRITDTGCAHIAKVKTLESLELCGGGIGDLGCTLLATLDNLQSLNLSQNERITNRGAAALAALTQLRALNLSNTHVNGSSLCFLSDLVHLESLALYGCRGIENGNGLDSLQDSLANLKCLRVNTTSDQDGTVVLPLSHALDDESDDEDEEGPSMPMAARPAGNLPQNEEEEEVSDVYSDHD